MKKVMFEKGLEKCFCFWVLEYFFVYWKFTEVRYNGNYHLTWPLVCVWLLSNDVTMSFDCSKPYVEYKGLRAMSFLRALKDCYTFFTIMVDFINGLAIFCLLLKKSFSTLSTLMYLEILTYTNYIILLSCPLASGWRIPTGDASWRSEGEGKVKSSYLFPWCPL